MCWLYLRPSIKLTNIIDMEMFWMWYTFIKIAYDNGFLIILSITVAIESENSSQYAILVLDI